MPESICEAPFDLQGLFRLAALARAHGAEAMQAQDFSRST